MTIGDAIALGCVALFGYAVVSHWIGELVARRRKRDSETHGRGLRP